MPQLAAFWVRLYSERMCPLFVPLKTEYFRAFASRAKTIEYRRYGPRWNEATCWLGRSVVLSHGYSGPRLDARIVGFSTITACEADCSVYAPETLLAVIALQLGRERPEDAAETTGQVQEVALHQ